MYKLKYTKTFEKDLKALSEKEQKTVAQKLKILAENPFYPSLRTKKVQGLDNVFEMSVNMDIRILWKYEDGIIILLLDVGHHKDILGVWTNKNLQLLPEVFGIKMTEGEGRDRQILISHDLEGMLVNK